MDWRTSPLIAAWWGEGRHPFCALLKIPLLPFAGVFAAATGLRSFAYARGWLATTRLLAPVISVGNLTVGGTGKTPMVRWVAERLVAAGRRTLVFSSGFGTTAGEHGLDEEGASLRRAVPGLSVMQGRDPRRALAEVLSARTGAPEVVVLDDGFQKLAIGRDLDIVMLDATRPFGSGLPIPAGPLRECRGALGRAHVVVLSRTELVEPDRALALKREVERRIPGVPVLRQRHEPAALIFSGGPASALRGLRVFLLSAIANPGAFEATVRRVGAQVAGHAAFRDHAPMSQAAVEKVLSRARALGADIVLSSTKDAPKLERFRGSHPPIDALDITVEFEDDPTGLERRMAGLFEQPDHAVPAHRS